MYSSKFCGSKAADFCGAVSSNIYILVSAKDLTETLDGHDQIFRRIIKKLQINGSPLNSIDFILKVESGDSTVSNQFSAEILDRLSEIWNDIAGSEQVSLIYSISKSIESFALCVMPVSYLLRKSILLDLNTHFQALSDRISLKVIVIDESEISSIESLRISHLATVANNAQTASAPDILGSSLAAAWGEIPSGVPRSLLNPVSSSFIKSCFTLSDFKID